MIYAYTYKYARQALREALEYAENHPGEIKRVKTREYTIVYMRNGDEHHFLSRAVYDKWCLGKTYVIGDTLYHSGFPLENDWKKMRSDSHEHH